MTQKAQDISKTNRINCGKKRSTHTSGPKSFARSREELREKDPEKKYPHRAVLYIQTHQTKSEKNKSAHVDDLKQLIVEQPDLADTSQGKVAWKGDALNKILGDEKPGHVHGLGLVPNPNQLFDPTTSRSLRNINLTSLDEKSSEDTVSMRLQMEKLVNRVHNQDATILELQQKTRTLEQQIQQGCLDDPMSIPKDSFCMDAPSSKRKREQTSDVDSEDLQAQYKYCCTKDKTKTANVVDGTVLQGNTCSTGKKAKTKCIRDDIRLDTSKYTSAAKVVDQETSSNFSNNEASHYQKHQRYTTNLSATYSLKVGTHVFLKSWKKQNKVVALATIVSCDPTQKLDGVQLGKEFWMVHVNVSMVDDEPLIRPCKSCNITGAVQGANTAWPSTFVEKLNA